MSTPFGHDAPTIGAITLTAQAASIPSGGQLLPGQDGCTITFADPGGYIWEIAQDLPSAPGSS